jgi:hypothetical protein
MPVWKFRNIEEMNECAHQSGADGLSRQEAIVSLMNSLVPPAVKRGVQKFRNMEEANEARLRAEAERARQMKESR